VRRTFVEKLIQAQTTRSNLALYVAPRLDRMPPAFQQYDDPFLPYMRRIYAATEDLVCAYIFNFADYLAIGAAGAIALERSIAFASETHITILDARFSVADYERVWDEAAFGCDAVTVTTDAPLTAFQIRSNRQAFTLTDSEDFPARYEIATGRFVLQQHIVHLLPLDTLDRARSLTFEDTLRSVVRAHALI
jgi:hypothetical protein